MTNQLHQEVSAFYGEEYLTELLEDYKSKLYSDCEMVHFYTLFEDAIIQTLKTIEYKDANLESIDVIMWDRLLKALEA